jgi:hypothetical protein
MKKVVILFALLFCCLFVSAETDACNLKVSMINQDPYLAIPGDYVKLVFQIDGVENTDCGDVSFELLEKFPISFDPNTTKIYSAKSGVYKSDYRSFLLAHYEVRVDEDALDGDNPIETQLRKNGLIETKKFNLNVEDVKADFEIFIKDYDSNTKTVTFEILNTAKSDVEALTLEIPKQNNIDIIGSKTNIVGDLDSNEYTSADFNGNLKQGEIKITISYTDEINNRRVIEKSVLFEPEYFNFEQEKSTPVFVYILIIIIIASAWFYYKKRKKMKK